MDDYFVHSTNVVDDNLKIGKEINRRSQQM